MRELTIQLMDHKKLDFEPELKKYCEKTGETISRSHFYPLLGESWFLFVKNGDLKDGWVVISHNKDIFTLEQYIRVEMAYSETDYNSMASISDDLNQLAKDVGASFIEMRTSFKPIADHAATDGYEIARYICRKPVEY